MKVYEYYRISLCLDTLIPKLRWTLDSGVCSLSPILRYSSIDSIEMSHIGYINHLNRLRLCVVYKFYNIVAHSDSPYIELGYITNLCSEELFAIDSKIFEIKGLNYLDMVNAEYHKDYSLSDKKYIIYHSVICNLIVYSDLVSLVRTDKQASNSFLKSGNSRKYYVLHGCNKYEIIMDESKIREYMLLDISNT